MHAGKAAVLAIVCAGAVASCASSGGRPETPFGVAMVQQTLAARKASKQPPQPLPALSQADLATVPAPLIEAEIVSRKAQARLTQVGQNGAYRTYMAPDGISVTLNGGLLTASRGLGPDLISAEITGVRHALAAPGGATYSRTLVLPDGDARATSHEFQCVMQADGAETLVIVGQRVATQRRLERCEGPLGAFENAYWLGGNGVVWQSRQWMGPLLGHIGITVLKM